MHDPLKEFVDKNRVYFDDQEAPKADWSRIRKVTPVIEQGPPKFKWLWMAASIVVMLGIGILVYNQQNAIQIEPSLADKTTISVPEVKSERVLEQQTSDNLPTVNNSIQMVANISKKEASTSVDGLADSTSASTRLLSILNLEKSGKMNLELAGKIAKTMAQDGNTNVRLAALNLLNQHKQKAYVSELLIQSLDTQNDPMVQLGLINSIGKSNNPLVNQRLLQIVERPTTFAMVRDEAYLLLMTHNAL